MTIYILCFSVWFPKSVLALGIATLIISGFPSSSDSFLHILISTWFNISWEITVDSQSSLCIYLFWLLLTFCSTIPRAAIVSYELCNACFQLREFMKVHMGSLLQVLLPGPGEGSPTKMLSHSLTFFVSCFKRRTTCFQCSRWSILETIALYKWSFCCHSQTGD